MTGVGNVHPSPCFLGYNRSNQPNPAHKRCQMFTTQASGLRARKERFQRSIMIAEVIW